MHLTALWQQLSIICELVKYPRDE